MPKGKYSVVKIFDNRKPLSLNNHGRQKRLCSCFAERNICEENLIENINENQSILETVKIEKSSINNVEESSCKENSAIDNLIEETEEINQTDIPELRTDTLSKFPLLQNLDLSESLEQLSDSETNSYCEESEKISSLFESTNSSWNNLSLKNFDMTQQTAEPQCKPRNYFPNVLNKKHEVLSKYISVNSRKNMNLSRDRNEIIIPIRRNTTSNFSRSQIEKTDSIQTCETSIECDLESDKNNTSLYECPIINLNSESSGKSNVSLSKKSNKKSDQQINRNVVLFAYISDIKSVEECLLLNKDRRFSKILDRYNCTAKILQMNNLARGFPHTLIKIEAMTKTHLNCLARDTDRIYSKWNIRSQLRSVHVL